MARELPLRLSYGFLGHGFVGLFLVSSWGGPPLPPTGEVAAARAPDGEAAQLACRASLGWGWGLGFGWVAWALAWLDSVDSGWLWA